MFSLYVFGSPITTSNTENRKEKGHKEKNWTGNHNIQPGTGQVGGAEGYYKSYGGQGRDPDRIRF